MKSPNLSIVIPAYQEATRIGATLDELAAYLKRQRWHDVEVVVVVAESPDGTAKLAHAKAPLFKRFRVVDAGPKVGKGRDVRIGLFAAQGEYRLFMDADLATPLHHLAEVRKMMERGVPVIIAVRNLQSTHTGVRKLLSASGNWLVRLLLLPGISDTQCGFKAFSAEAVERLFSRQHILGWGFDMEILAIARMQRLEIGQIPAPDWDDKPDGTFEGQVGSAALETLGELFQILWRKYTGGYRKPHYLGERG